MMAIKFLLFFAAVFFSKTTHAEGWNIFGKDDRVELTSTEYPWKAIGYLSTGCTGTLVGRDLMLTAAHCVMDGETGKLSPNLTYFYPNRINGEAKDQGWMDWVWWGTTKPNEFRGSDWAVVRLKEPLGDTYGWMGVETEDHSKVILAGYSGDFKQGLTAGVHQDCHIKKRQAGLVFHDCDNARGASGGPLFIMKENKAFIVALNVAEFRNGGDTTLTLDSYDDEHANIAVPASAFLEKIIELKK